MTTKKTTTHKKETHPKDEKKETKPVEKKTEKHEDAIHEIDKKIEEINEKFGIVDKLLKQEWMKKFLALKFVEDMNKSVKPNLKSIFTVIAVLAFIGALVSLIGFFGVLGLGALGASGLFVLIMAIVLLVSTVLNLLGGIGLLSKKKWLPTIILLTLVWQVLFMIIGVAGTAFAVGTSQWVSLIVMLMLTTIVLKNKSYFNK